MAELLSKIAEKIIELLVNVVISGLIIYWAWSYFPFLNNLHDMSWWDGMVLFVLCNHIFKRNPKSD